MPLSFGEMGLRVGESRRGPAKTVLDHFSSFLLLEPGRSDGSEEGRVSELKTRELKVGLLRCLMSFWFWEEAEDWTVRLESFL